MRILDAALPALRIDAPLDAGSDHRFGSRLQFARVRPGSNEGKDPHAGGQAQYLRIPYAFEALYHRRPVYMAFPADLAEQLVLTEAQPIAMPRSNPKALASAVNAISERLQHAATACVLPGILIARCGYRSQLLDFVDRTGLPFATMFMAKTVLHEQHPSYLGMYDGALMNEEVQNFVEGLTL